jgi:hypothetical protein
MTTDTQFQYRGSPHPTKRTDRQCYDCGYYLGSATDMLLHYDFHAGEFTVRPVGCICGETYDIRVGICLHCKRITNTDFVSPVNAD